MMACNSLCYSRGLVTVVATLALACAIARPVPRAQGKPDDAPVKVEYAPPPAMKTGDVTATTIKFRALADLDRIVVDIAPFSGVTLLSQPTMVTFVNVKRGDAPELNATVRLTDPKFGLLAVNFSAWVGADSASGATTIVYGDASP